MQRRFIAGIAGALGLLWGITAAAYAQAETVVQISELTSTGTAERLILQAQVSPTDPAASFEWRFTLRNTEGNTVRVAEFSVSPRCDLTGINIIGTPEGWTATTETAGDGRILWRLTLAADGSNAAQQLDPGETFVFSFLLNKPARQGGGTASARNSQSFSGATVSCVPTETEFNFEMTQARPASFKRTPDPALPPGITWTGCCITGDPRSDIRHTDLACRFVGAVFCIDPGADGKFTSFALGGPAGTDTVVRAVRLIRTIPLVERARQLWPGGRFVQSGEANIRTFFPLKFTPCDTLFTLEVEFDAVSRDASRRVVDVRLNRFNYRVSVRPETLEWVIDALHCDPLGLCEVPCISDEDAYQTLIRQSRELAAAGTNTTAALAALDALDATIMRYCLFGREVFQVDDQGNLLPCAIFAGRLPGNRTFDAFGFGIVDTVENPCCSKLISDIDCLRRQISEP
jgi:hypothetical protein